jgi:hypothetical protein
MYGSSNIYVVIRKQARAKHALFGRFSTCKGSLTDESSEWAVDLGEREMRLRRIIALKKNREKLEVGRGNRCSLQSLAIFSVNRLSKLFKFTEDDTIGSRTDGGTVTTRQRNHCGV